MSRFLTPLRLEDVDTPNAGWLQRPLFLLLSDFIYYSDLLQQCVICKEGTLTDLASVPRLPIAFLLTGDTGRKAGVVHDELYRTGIVSRELADAVFKEALLAQGEPLWRVNLMYLGVRAGGWVAWNNHRRATA